MRCTAWVRSSLELWNWGTFHPRRTVLEPRRGWALLDWRQWLWKVTAIDALRLCCTPRILNYNDVRRRRRPRVATARAVPMCVSLGSSSTIDSTAPTTQYLPRGGAQRDCGGLH